MSQPGWRLQDSIDLIRLLQTERMMALTRISRLKPYKQKRYKIKMKNAIARNELKTKPSYSQASVNYRGFGRSSSAFRTISVYHMQQP